MKHKARIVGPESEDVTYHDLEFGYLHEGNVPVVRCKTHDVIVAEFLEDGMIVSGRTCMFTDLKYLYYAPYEKEQP